MSMYRVNACSGSSGVYATASVRRSGDHSHWCLSVYVLPGVPPTATGAKR